MKRGKGHTRTLLLLALMLPFFLTSCIKEERYLTDSSVRLQFSEDTVAFDTVFTTMATITKQVKVYNRYDETILIDAITLRGGSTSRFRINVDGDDSFVARDVEIRAGDSIFIFIQANINPNDATSPFLVEDAIRFDFNHSSQQLPLTAYGRNAVYHHPTHRAYATYTNGYGNPDTLWFPYSIIDCSNWNHSLPHVIFGYAVVNSNETLHLLPGDELFFATDSYLWVYDSATLDVRGSQGNPVKFTSLRHDSYYDSLPGQWGYIWLSAGSKDNYIDWAYIENGTAGLLVDTNVNNNPTLQIFNSIIINQSLSGITGQGSYIVGDNLLVANSGNTLLSLQYGGRYQFSNSTFANYWRYSSQNRKLPAVVLNNYYQYDRTTRFPRDLKEASFSNCVIYGNFNGLDGIGELLLDYSDEALFNCSFSHCLIRTTLIDSSTLPSAVLIINRDPQFSNPTGNDYHPTEGSPAIAAGDPAALRFPYDLDGTTRPLYPTIGAFEPIASDTKRSTIHNPQTIIHHSPCSTTLQENLSKPTPHSQSSTATGLVSSSKYHSTPIVQSKIWTR